jgi:hypothetical protein
VIADDVAIALDIDLSAYSVIIHWSALLRRTRSQFFPIPSQMGIFFGLGVIERSL